MKKISITTGTLITLLLAAVTGLAQTKSRDDILKEIEVKRRLNLAALQKQHPGTIRRRSSQLR